MSASQFTFVPVDIGHDEKGDNVAPDYRSIIRSLSARNPWNRPVRGETIIPGLQTKPAPRKLAPRPPTRRIFKPSSNHVSPSSSSSSFDSQLPQVETEPTTSADAPSQSSLNPIVPLESQSPNPYALPDHALSRVHDPFWLFPVPYRGYMSRILEHKFTTSTRYLPILDDPSVKQDPSKWALSQIWVENHESPTYLYAVLLHSGAFLSAMQTPYGSPRDINPENPPEGAPFHAIAGQEHLLWLRLSAIRAINTDLRDPEIMHHPRKYAKFASLLAAISTLASYEFHFGDRAVQRAHHHALARLVSLRGGLHSIDELQRRFYVFILKVSLLSAASGVPDAGTAEFVASASALRDLLREPAKLLGCEDLDELLGPEEV